MKARGNVIVVKLDKSCNLVFVRQKSDIHEYVFLAPENLSTIFWTKLWTQFFALEIVWLVQKTNQVAKKFGPIFCQKNGEQIFRGEKNISTNVRFGLTKTKWQLLSCFITITLPLAFISICYLP